MRDLLSANALTVGYRKDRPIVSDLTLTLVPGEIVTLIGPNGAGKSTILKSLAAQLQPLAGTILIDGKPEAQMREIELAKRLSLFLTGRIHTELMTCEDVASTGRYPYTGRLGILTAEDRRIVNEAMQMTHVEELRHSPAGGLTFHALNTADIDSINALFLYKFIGIYAVIVQIVSVRKSIFHRSGYGDI